MSTARIYRPAKNAMQSGKANVQKWVLEFEPETRETTDSLMGWVGSSDMKQEIKLQFDSKESAISYAEKNGIDFEVHEPHNPTTKIKSYAENFTG